MNILDEKRQLFGNDLPLSMVITYQMQVESLEKKCPAAINLLKYAALLAPDNIPPFFLKKVLVEKSIPSEDFDPYDDGDREKRSRAVGDYEKAFQALKDYALIEDYERPFQVLKDYALLGSDKGMETVRMHRLTQDVVKLHLTKDEIRERLLELARFMRIAYKNKDYDYQPHMLFPQMEALYQSAKQQSNLSQKVEFVNLLITIANYYQFYLGDYKKAITLYEDALPLQERHYGSEHPEIARTLTDLGTSYGAMGNYEKQTDSLERALNIKKKAYGEFHRKLANTLVKLGNAYGDQGKYDKKREMLEQAYKIFSTCYGPEELVTSMVLTNLGAVHIDLEDYLEAKSMLEKAVKIQEKLYRGNDLHLSVEITSLEKAYGLFTSYDRRTVPAKEVLKKYKVILNNLGVKD